MQVILIPQMDTKQAGGDLSSLPPVSLDKQARERYVQHPVLGLGQSARRAL
jgi:hypothetical protein